MGGKRKQKYITSKTTILFEKMGYATHCLLCSICSQWQGEKTWQSLARINNSVHSIGACGKEWDSPPEVGGRRKQKYITSKITILFEKMGYATHCLLCSMCSQWQGEKTWQSLARINNSVHRIGACGKEWDSPSEVGRRRKQKYITSKTTILLQKMGYATHCLLCSMCTQWQGEKTWQSLARNNNSVHSIGACGKSGTHHLRWEEGENSNI